MQDSLCHYSNENLGIYFYASSSFVFQNMLANVLDTSWLVLIFSNNDKGKINYDI